MLEEVVGVYFLGVLRALSLFFFGFFVFSLVLELFFLGFIIIRSFYGIFFLGCHNTNLSFHTVFGVTYLRGLSS